MRVKTTKHFNNNSQELLQIFELLQNLQAGIDTNSKIEVMYKLEGACLNFHVFISTSDFSR